MRTRSLGAWVAGSLCAGLVISITALWASKASDRTQWDDIGIRGSEQGHDVADRTFRAFSGSKSQGDAAAWLQAYALNGAMDACMAGEGFPEWDWSRARNIQPTVDALGTSVFFGRPLDLVYSRTAVEIRTRIQAEESLSKRVISAEENAAIDACIASTPETSDDEATAQSLPTGVLTLRERWWSLLRDLDRRFGSFTEYDTCLKSQRLPVLASDRPVDELPQAVSERLPASHEIPQDAGDPASQGRRWQEFLRLEREVVAADWSCRKHVYAQHVSDVHDAIQDFAEEHAREIEAARVGWLQIEERARMLGFQSS